MNKEHVIALRTRIENELAIVENNLTVIGQNIAALQQQGNREAANKLFLRGKIDAYNQIIGDRADDGAVDRDNSNGSAAGPEEG